ncbi:polysaccharide deacetylase family protein [Maridesulfovibrio hydrothermalis]|uniref:NodB homology domain-containing protein n=1 Tax=Maridesulfovibrio hydrothermalis AM13 = DSM 14728 TaxID=1121451 RepID=L0RF86_9BACT|nr:polysaccharide deacetylase family protein [Maridesulfovibrio hydrothermalis]CCO24236.1 conserved protein of unknown function [Maridesulfovibrio hydrothermalis AM13 = DSM 14728]
MLYCVMFHHFYDNRKHHNGQGALSLLDFQMLLDWLDDNYTILSPDNYYSKIKNKTLLPTDVCLTFDDSLKSQYDIALPELETRNIKAFYFVYSNAFSNSPDSLEFYRDFRNTYFDDIDEFYDFYFQHMKQNSSQLYEEYQNKYHENYLADFPYYTENDKRFRFMRDQILTSDEYEYVMDELLAIKGYSKSKRRKFLFMSVEDLKQISNLGHTIGLHSHSHPTQISTLTEEQQLSEYTQNKEFVADITQKDVWAMSHPCGNYNKTTLSILEKIGIKVGFRSSLSIPDIKSNLEIPREDHANLIKKVKSRTQ